MSNFTDLDQLFLEYVNRARLDPLREVDRLLADTGVTDSNLRASLEDLGAIGLNRGLAADTVSGLALQPLAPEAMLRDAALGHSDWMLDANIFSHTGQNGSSIANRIEAAGYSLAAPAGWGENLSWQGTFPNAINMQAAVINHAAGLFDSDGHRRNILTEWFRETGVAQVEGVFTHDGTDWNASMLTQKFAMSGTDVFLTGVVYSDKDEDGFYSLGEGEGGVFIAASGASTFSANAGGYALALGAAPDVAITLTWGEISIGVQVDLSAGNVKLDLVAGSDDSLRLLSSGNLVLGAGAEAAQLLGAADLSLQANDSGNLLLGNYGDNTLTGGAGNDTLQGGAGNDTLDGGGGVNTARFSGNRADYDIITDTGTGITTVTDLRGAGSPLNPHDGTNTLHNIHQVEFADQVFELTTPDGTGGVIPMATAFTITGFGFSMAEGTGQVTDITGPATLALSFTQAAPVISYSAIAAPSGGPVAIEFGGDEPILSTLNNGLIVGDPEILIAALQWSEGGTPRATDVLILNYSVQEQYMFVVGGDPLPASMTPATLESIIAQANTAGVTLPDAGSNFPPDAPIALTGLAGWNAVDTSTLHTTTISGFSFTEDDSHGNGYPNALPSTLSVTFADAGASLIHEIIGLDNDTGAAFVRISFDELPLELRLNGELLGDEDIDILAARIVSDGQTYDVLIIDDLVNDRQHVLQLAGSPLPDGADPAAVTGFWAGVTSFSAITDGPAAAGTPILLSAIPGAVTVVMDGPTEPEIELTAITLTGISFNPDDSNFDVQTTQLSVALPSPDTMLTYTQVGIVEENDFGGAGFALVEFDFSAPPLGLTFGGLQRDFDDGDYSLEMARFVTSNGTHDILFIDDSATGRQYLFQLGGDPLAISNDAQLLDFFGTVSTIDPIPDSDPLGQGQPIALGNVQGAMTTPIVPYTVAGYQMVYNTSISSENAQSIAGAEMTILAPADNATFFYNDIGPVPDGGGSLVTLSSTGPFFVQVAGLDNPLALQTQIVRLTDGNGVSYDILEFINETGAFTNLDFFFQIGGPALEFADVAAFNAFGDTITSYDSIPHGDPLGPDTPIALAGLGVLTPPAPEPVTGTGDPAVITFSGYRIDEDENEVLLGYAQVELSVALPVDDAVYSYEIFPGWDDDDTGFVDIFGPRPYEVLIDGVAARVGFNFEFERITVDGISYDLMVLNDLGLDGSMFVFQIDGATPLPFASLQDIQDFVDAAESQDGFSPIPQSSPFAEGSDFTFLDSPYATADTDPALIFGGDTFVGPPSWGVGRGAGAVGSMTVVNGQQEILGADGTGAGPFLSVGRGADAFGTLTVAGPGSSVSLVAGGGTTLAAEGASVSIGRDGGTGSLRVLDGGSFSISDPVGTTAGPNFDGNELLWVGRGQDAYGYIDIDGGSFVHSGTGTIAAFGRQGGDGVLNVTNGGTYRQQTTSDDDFTMLSIGRDGGYGTAYIGYGRVTVQAGDTGDGVIEIGVNSGAQWDPAGRVYITGDGSNAHGLMITGGANSPFVGLNFGRNGTAEAEIYGGYLGVLNRGVTYDDDLNQIDLQGYGGDAEMSVGRDGGFAQIWAEDESEIFVLGSSAARMFIGAGQDSQGEVFLSASQLNVFSWNGVAGLEIGTWDGGTGLLWLDDGSEADIWGGFDAYVNVGRGAGNTGTLQMQGSHLFITADTGYATMNIGRNGGTGDVQLDDSLIVIMARGDEPYAAIGRDGGTGTLSISGQYGADPDAVHGFVLMGGAQSPFATVDVGRGAGGMGTVTVSGAQFGVLNHGVRYSLYADPVDLDGDGGRANIRIGFDGGTGILNADDGSRIFVEGGSDGAALLVGEVGGTGTVNLEGGDLLVEGRESHAFLGIGRNGGTGTMTLSDGVSGLVELLDGSAGYGEASISVGDQGNAQGGAGTGSLTIEGMQTGLSVASAKYANLYVGGGEGGAGTGTVIVRDGATLSYESAEHQQLNIGYNGGTGSLLVETGGAVTSLVTGAGFDSFMLIGTEGGTGDVTVDGGTLSIVAEDGNAGIRIGTRWTHTLDNTGTGSIVLEGGASALIEGSVTSNFWVGGLDGGNGTAIIRTGAELSLTGDERNSVIVGGVFGSVDMPGGEGELTVTGAGSAISGANRLIVGYNNGTGTMTIEDGATVELVGSSAVTDAFVGIGIPADTGNGGTGSVLVEGVGSVLSVRGTDAEMSVGEGAGSTGALSLSSGAQVHLEAGVGGPVGDTGALLIIGSNGGSAQVTVHGQDTQLSVTQGNSGADGGAIRIAAGAGGSTGLLHVSNGATVLANAVEIGGAMATLGVLHLDYGTVTTPGSTSVFENGWLGGNGTINGNLNVTAGEFRVGDSYDADTGVFTQSEGVITVVGDASFGASLAAFEFAYGHSDLLNVSGALNFDGTTINVDYLGFTDLAQSGVETMLAQAGGGITLNGVNLTSSIDGLDGADPALELRADGTELWFISGAELPPQTGQALTLTQLGQSGTTITYAISIDPALVSGGVLQDLDLTLDFDSDLIGYVPGSISGGFTATPGSLVISGSDLNITDLGQPVVTFDMQLTSIAGGRNVSFDLSSVSVNGVAMEDQTGEDAFGFAYDPAFYTLGGLVELRDVRATPSSAEDTVVTFTETGGTQHQAMLAADGTFSFLLEAGTTGDLSLVRDYNAPPLGPDKALGIQDVLSMFRMVVGVPGLDVDDTDIIAGDFNDDGVVNIQDVLALFRHVVGVPNAIDPEFIFVDQDNLPSASLGNVPVRADSFEIGALSADVDMSFLGILSGDLQNHL
ncbi:CAP domain-containing protein [Roseinatronobacter sp. S2]|uniref:CAP domain-containing protein n=1 Tax=Roseinatronobacter sp. S2 TaxID=3035471 RepID=UPI00240F49F7|nr:CAP domain-containing protein [Roseinatronobacter sp. S2]WFE75627.1 CAP domain-containing protein [Roseinatronobacter sp. S2]